MTNEEAIKKLEHYRYCLKFQYGWYGKDDDEAIDMAIQALEKTGGDLISRKAVINMFNTMDRYKTDKLILQDTDRKFPGNEVFIVDDCYELLEQLPTYSAEQTVKENKAENLHREKEQAYYKGFEDGRKMLLDRMKGRYRRMDNKMNDLISRQSVIIMLNKIENAVEDGDGFQFNEWVKYAKNIPSFEKTADGDLITEIDKLPRIKVGNSNSPTVKYCIDEALLYDLLERYKAEKTAEWIKQKSGDELFPEEIVCSKCYHSNSHLDFDEHNNPIGKVFLESKYCPNCGAKMKEDTE